MNGEPTSSTPQGLDRPISHISPHRLSYPNLHLNACAYQQLQGAPHLRISWLLQGGRSYV